LAGNGISYMKPSSDNFSVPVESNDDESPFYFSTEKTLTEYDIRCSSLVSIILFYLFCYMNLYII